MVWLERIDLCYDFLLLIKPGQNRGEGIHYLFKSRNSLDISKYYFLSDVAKFVSRVSPGGCYLGRFVRTDACVSAPNKQVQGRGSHSLGWTQRGEYKYFVDNVSGRSRSRVGTLVNTDGIKLELQTNHQQPKFSQSRRRPLLGPSPGLLVESAYKIRC